MQEPIDVARRETGDLTVSAVARELHIRRENVITFLRSGALAGYDVSLPDARKKSYRIPRAAVDAFKAGRTVAQPEPVKQSRKRSAPMPVEIREFF